MLGPCNALTATEAAWELRVDPSRLRGRLEELGLLHPVGSRVVVLAGELADAVRRGLLGDLEGTVPPEKKPSESSPAVDVARLKAEKRKRARARKKR